MRFDLEIPSQNIELAYITEGNNIQNSLTPLLYMSINKEKLASDFVDIDNIYVSSNEILTGYTKINGPLIRDIKSDKFLITNIIKILQNNTEIPFFYKHKIPYKIKEDGINIIDYYGNKVSKEEYVIHINTNSTIIYMNKTEKILFLEYSSNNNLNKEILNLVPVFQEATWDDIEYNILPKQTYLLKDNIIETSHDEDLYIHYISNGNMIRNVIANIDEPWYLGILNADFKIENNRYRVPEYFLQDFDNDYRQRLIKNNKCISIENRYIKTQCKIAINELDNVEVYAYNNSNNKLIAAFSTNRSLEGRLYKDNISYEYIDTINNDGFIYLPIEIEPYYSFYASYFIDEEYFQYKSLDLNSDAIDNSDYIVIFLKPNILDNERSVFHAVIGGLQNDFDTIEEYEINATENGFFTIAIVSVKNNIKNAANYIDITCDGGKVINKEYACKISKDILYKDIIDKKISLPVNDLLIANINIKSLQDKGYLRIDSETLEFDDFSLEYINKINDILGINLDASTQYILEINTNI